MVLVCLLRYWDSYIWKLFWFTWLHLYQHCHKVVITKHAEWSCFWFCINIISIPFNYIIFKYLTELMLSMNLIFYDFLSWTAIEEINPCLWNFLRFLLGSFEKAMLKFVWSLVNVEDWEYWECNEDQNCPYSANDNSAFSKFNMPNL